jgi:hypothetical protein
MRPLVPLLLATLLVGVAMPPARAATPGGRPLADALDSDGTLRAGVRGSLDPTGWRLASGLDGAPRFVPVGGGWSELGGPVNQIVNDIVVDSDDNVYIAGTFTEVADVSTAPLYMVARWDGSAWASLGGANDWIFALALSPEGGTLYAAGRFTQIGGVTASRVASWNGSAWSAMGPGFNNPPEDLVVDSGGTLYVGGGMNVVGGGSPRAIFEWTGSAWVVPGGGNGVNNHVYSLAVDAADNLYVGGSFTSVNGVTTRNIARWDGTTWTEVGGGTQTTGAVVYALEVNDEGHLYAGGFFTEMGGGAVSHLARWDGSAWADVAGGVSGSTGGGTAVRAITFDGADLLYIGGSFTEAGGVTVNGVARLQGGAWGSLDGGVGNGTVVALAVASDTPYLYAGGGFSSIGGVTGLNYFAKYEGGVTAPVEPGTEAAPAALLLDPAYPNPFAHEAALRFTAARTQAVRLEVLDALGRRMALLFDGVAAAGRPVEVRLDGRGLPAGAYVARLTGEDGSVVRRLTLAR